MVTFATAATECGEDHCFHQIGKIESERKAIMKMTKIAMLVLTIAVPPAGTSLSVELVALWPSYLTYAVSFLLIGTIWINHDRWT